MVLPAEQQRRQRLLIPALHFVCGFSNGLPDVAKRMMFVNTLQIEPAVQAALFGVLLSVPWQFKLGMAFLTDSVPIGGRRRIPYLLVCLSVQAVVNLCIGLLVGPELSVGVLAGLLFASTVAQVMIGTILDTLTVENMRNEVGKEVGSLQSNCWIALQLGGLLGLLLGGWAMQYAGLSVAAIYLSVGIVKAVSLVCTFPIYDPKVPASQRDPARCGIKVRVLLSQVWETMKDPIIWKPTVFLFIFAAKPGNADAFNSFLAGKQHNDVEPQPLGFSESQIAYIGMFGTAANALGAFMYKGCLRQVPLRVLFGTLITFGALVASSQLVLIWGLNTQWNLPDFWFAIGDDVVIHVSYPTISYCLTLVPSYYVTILCYHLTILPSCHLPSGGQLHDGHAHARAHGLHVPQGRREHRLRAGDQRADGGLDLLRLALEHGDLVLRHLAKRLLAPLATHPLHRQRQAGVAAAVASHP